MSQSRNNVLFVGSALLGTGVLLTTVSLMLLTDSSAEATVQEVSRPMDDGTPKVAPKLASLDPSVDRQLRSESSSENGFYAAPTGSAFLYVLESETVVPIEIGQQGRSATQEFRSRFEGRLEVLVVDRLENELVAQLHFPQARILDSATGSESMRNELREQDLLQPVLVRMNDDGSLLGFRFDPGTNAETRMWIRGLVASLRFVVRRGVERSWESSEIDPTGEANVRYSWDRKLDHGDKGLLQKTKLNYLSLTHQNQSNSLPVECSVDGKGKATLNPELAWIEAVEYEEKVQAEVEGFRLLTSVESRVDLQLLSSTRRPRSQLPDVNWDDEWSSVAGGEDIETLAAGSDLEFYESFLSGVTLADLISQIVQLVGADPLDSEALTDAFRKLSWFLRVHPDALDGMHGILASTPANAAGVILSSMGAAGTPEAQAFLTGFVTDSSRPLELRESGLQSMFQLSTPTAGALDCVTHLVEDPNENPEIRATGMLLSGALASMNLQSTGTDRDEAVAKILGYEEQATENEMVHEWLHSLGNTGHFKSVAAAEPYLTSEDAEVRNSAIAAIRKVDAPEATALLARHAVYDTDSKVRRSAVEVISRRSEPLSRSAVEKVLANDSSVEVRRSAVFGLGQQLPDESVRPLLEQVARSDSSTELRQYATEVLQGEKH